MSEPVDTAEMRATAVALDRIAHGVTEEGDLLRAAASEIERLRGRVVELEAWQDRVCWNNGDAADDASEFVARMSRGTDVPDSTG